MGIQKPTLSLSPSNQPTTTPPVSNWTQILSRLPANRIRNLLLIREIVPYKSANLFIKIKSTRFFSSRRVESTLSVKVAGSSFTRLHFHHLLIQHLDLYNIVIIRQHPEKKATEVENTMLSVVYV